MKKIIIAFVFLIIAIGGWYEANVYQVFIHSSSVKNQSTKIIVYQQIISSSKNLSHFDTITVAKGSTALDLLAKTVPLKTKGTGTKAFVTSINNRDAEDSKKEFWAFYINGKQASVGAGIYVLQPGDKILWKIETY